MTNDEERLHLAHLAIIKERARVLSEKIVTLGFDGFIDSVVKVVEHKDSLGAPYYFESTKSFGEYIVEKGNKSFSIELEEMTTKLGGNMPIMANAVARMGPQVSCIGPLGHPIIHPVFKEMSNCHLYSYANPGLSKVLEFRSGKIMLAEMTGLNKIPWDLIRESVGLQKFVDLFSKSDLIALLNWSELDNSTAIWHGLLREVLPRAVSLKKAVGFFDLSDCSKRGDAPIHEALDLLHDFSRYLEVVLSLNLNEATIVHAVLFSGNRNKAMESVEKMCQDIFDRLKIHTVIIHSPQQSLAQDQDGLYMRKSFFIKAPTISSGAGDNFNAGFAIGKLMGLKTGTSLAIGHAASTLYMQSANSPSVEDVFQFLSNNLTACGPLEENI